MGMGIIVCGLNGSGKSTLGKALAGALGFYFIDNEDLYFPKSDPNYLYAAPRTRAEVEKRLQHELRAHEDFVFASVRGDYGDGILPFFQRAVLVEVPRDIRLKRVRDRSFRKFGSRMLAGGDLYEQETAFFRLAASRPEDYTETWLETLSCPVLRVDGTKPPEENVALIVQWL